MNNTARYQVLRNARDIDDADHITVTAWYCTGQGAYLAGDDLDAAVDKAFNLTDSTDEQRYIALRNRPASINEFMSVTFWEYNPNDSVNNGIDVTGDNMDKIIDELIARA